MARKKGKKEKLDFISDSIKEGGDFISGSVKEAKKPLKSPKVVHKMGGRKKKSER